MTQPKIWSPKPWLAALLSFPFPMGGFLYGASFKLAAIYVLLLLSLVPLHLYFVHTKGATITLSILATAVCVIHAYINAGRYPAGAVRPWYSRWPVIICAYVLFLGVLITFRGFVYEPFRAPASSMAPSIPRGANLVVQKWGYGNYQAYGIQLARTGISAPLKRGDVLVFMYPPEPDISYVKRLIGLPGDVVAYKNKILSINGTPVSREASGEYFDEERVSYLKIVRESLDGVSYSTYQDEKIPESVRREHVLAFPGKNLCSYDDFGFSCTVPAERYFVMGDHRDNSFDSRYWGFVPASHVIGVVSKVF